MKLHFSIRDLLWLTVVAALAIGWWLDHQATNNAFASEAKARQKVEQEYKEFEEETLDAVKLMKRSFESSKPN